MSARSVRCWFGVHRWGPWGHVRQRPFGALNVFRVRICSRCRKRQAQAVGI